STVNESTCALSARQLGNPYCRARSNCASARRAAGFAFRSSPSQRLACLRSQSRLGESGSDRGGGGGGSDMTHLLSFRPPSAVGARKRRLSANSRGRVEPFTRTVGRPRGASGNITQRWERVKSAGGVGRGGRRLGAELPGGE